MAHTTLTNDGQERMRITADGNIEIGSTPTFCGRKVPRGVLSLDTMFDELNHQNVVVWVTINGGSYGGTRHTMPYEETPESITAVLVAMKLSC